MERYDISEVNYITKSYSFLIAKGKEVTVETRLNVALLFRVRRAKATKATNTYN